MELMQTDGIVLKVTAYKDNDVILTIFTQKLGKIQVAAKGVKSYKNKLSAGCRIFSYSEFVLAPGRELYRLRDCSLKHSFYSLSANIERLAFATYLADLTGFVTQEASPNEDLLRLILNAFHLLAHSRRDLRLVRAVYELKLLQYAGFAPDVNGCVICGDTEHVDYFDPAAGGLVCAACANGEMLELPEPCLIAMRYVLFSPDKKAFSFALLPQYVAQLEQVLEKFIEYHIDKHFYSLDYLKNILGEPPHSG